MKAILLMLGASASTILSLGLWAYIEQRRAARAEAVEQESLVTVGIHQCQTWCTCECHRPNCGCHD